MTNRFHYWRGETVGPLPTAKPPVSPGIRAQLDLIAIQCGTDKSSTWHAYTRLYEQYLSPFPSGSFLIEIGVAAGASLAMWRRWRPDWRILGIDNDAASPADFHGDGADVCLVPPELRHPDIVIDDGSHQAKDVIGAFRAWWPQVRAAGVYVIEDLHCSFDSAFTPQDGLRPIDLLTGLAIQCMEEASGMGGAGKPVPSGIASDIDSVHFHKSIGFVFKK